MMRYFFWVVYGLFKFSSSSVKFQSKSNIWHQFLQTFKKKSREVSSQSLRQATAEVKLSCIYWILFFFFSFFLQSCTTKKLTLAIIIMLSWLKRHIIGTEICEYSFHSPALTLVSPEQAYSCKGHCIIHWRFPVKSPVPACQRIKFFNSLTLSIVPYLFLALVFQLCCW